MAAAAPHVCHVSFQQDQHTALAMALGRLACGLNLDKEVQ
jgi:hypothetical protein